MSIVKSRLDDVCEVIMGQAPRGESYNLEGKGLPLIAGAGDFGNIYPVAKKFTTEASKISRVGDIVLGIRATIGEKVLSDGEYCLGRGVAALRTLSTLDSRYLWHWLEHIRPKLASKAKGATFKQVTRQDIAEQEISLPPIAQQKRIAAILDRAEELRSLRRQALGALDAIVQSIFLEMFGDPLTNPKKWEIKQCKNICSRITVGIVVQPASYYQEQGVPALRSLNIKQNSISTDNLVFFSKSDNETKLSKTRVKARDVVLVRTGQPGTAAVIPDELDGVNAIDLLLTTPRQDAVDSTYLCYFFNSSSGKALVSSSQVGQIQKHLNVGILNEAPILLPPLSLQQEFARRVEAIEPLKTTHREAIAHLDALFASLQHRAFRGEL